MHRWISNDLTTSPYSNQDGSGTLKVEDGGLTFSMEGSRWRKSDQSFTVAPNTVVAFEFSSTSQGEIHGLGFDEDDTFNNGRRVFRVFGTQSWSGDINWFRAYTTSEVGTVKTYVIPVGRYYSGSGFRLVLVNDKDFGTLDNTSRFGKVRVYELQ